MKKDIQTKEDIELLVNTFYTDVLKNPYIGFFFKGLNFEHHMPKMIHFWSFVLLDEPGYTTNVTQKHENMHLQPEHFDIWVKLFSETVDRFFEGEKAEMAKSRAKLLALTMASKFRN
jgi:hemoglobin